MKYSDKMQMNYEVDHDKGIVTFEDGTPYSRDEMKKMEGMEPEHMRMLHKLKRIFGGSIVQ